MRGAHPTVRILILVPWRTETNRIATRIERAGRRKNPGYCIATRSLAFQRLCIPGRRALPPVARFDTTDETVRDSAWRTGSVPAVVMAVIFPAAGKGMLLKSAGIADFAGLRFHAAFIAAPSRAQREVSECADEGAADG